MNPLFIASFLAVTLILTVVISFYAYHVMKNGNREKIRNRLKAYITASSASPSIDIEDKKLFSEIPLLNRIFLKAPGVRRLTRLLQQANSPYPPGFYVFFSILLMQIGFVTAILFTGNYFIAVISAAVFGVSPFLYILKKKNKRIRKFGNQLPEALDLIARALKAGHAFTSGMKLAASEFEDPLGTEFQETLDQINFGISVQAALKSLGDRIDCQDLKYFVVSVILQRETGGNLATIIENIARLMRERAKLKGKIRTLSAEGRLSAMILLGLPFVIVLALRFSNPKYIDMLFTVPAGRIMVAISLMMMGIGALVIRKIVNFKV
ncbi:MAG: type II secretion system F family protein [Syntrophales bacterium]|jgi:tight adherence protein B|nr:type II secretion system F family protein [Syntrophales bacterium]MDY0044750.1 type II secretion system F family protein [Syntrophales bacterium]